MRIDPGFGSGGAHRGGAWKVAYADFVTALMALFIVLWLLNSSEKVRQNVTRYFVDPRGAARASEGKNGPGGDAKAGGAQRGPGAGAKIALDKNNAHELQQRLEQAFKALPEFEYIKKHIRITITGEGLRIELLESEAGMFFETGRPEPSREGQRLLELITRELSRLPNTVIIEGHTDARPFRNEASTGYSNWDLSLERANAARKLMEGYGLRSGQVVQIRGFGDRKLLFAQDPADSRNRRISVTVVYWQDEVSRQNRP